MTSAHPTVETTTHAPPRSSWKLIVDPVFGPFYLGKLLSVIGNWVYNIAGAIVVFELTGSAAFVGAVSASQFAPQLFLTPLSGVWADRGNRKLQIVLGRALLGAAALALAAAFQFAALEGTAGAWAVVLASLVVGIGFAVGGPASQAIVPELVHQDELGPAVAIASSPFTVARAGGPALGAVLVTTLGPAVAFLVASMGSLSFVALVLVTTPPSQGTSGRGADSRMRAGLHHLRHDRRLATILVGTAAIGIGADPSITLTPSLAAQLGNAALAGALASSFGVGAGLAFPLLGRIRGAIGLPTMSTVGLLLMALGPSVASLTTFAAALLGMAISGAGMTLSMTGFMTLTHDRSPDDLRGRFLALWMLANLGTRPFIAAMDGYLADQLSVQAALWFVSAVVLACAWISRPRGPRQLTSS